MSRDNVFVDFFLLRIPKLDPVFVTKKSNPQNYIENPLSFGEKATKVDLVA